VPGQIVLAGHSYGGAVMTNAAAGDPDEPAWKNIPSWSLVAGSDHNIPIEAQRRLPGNDRDS
jgi:pimeloyl-ACP methyl ester carboxylesterase